jgi:hypothetical protein
MPDAPPQFVDELIQLPNRFLIPFTEASAPVQTHEPSQERDVAGVDLRGPSHPRGPEFVQSLIDTVGGEAAAHALASVWQQANVAKKELPIVNALGGETDGQGNLDLLLFEVPQGYVFQAGRVNLEAVGFSPASPYSNSSAWVALIRGARFATGSILDFGPPASGGTIFPSIFSTGTSHAPQLYGGEILTLHVVGAAGLANTGITARLQGRLTEL